ncbi:MAG: PGF-pre-PGF domain-containing protein [Methanoregulaceae archaeon]
MNLHYRLLLLAVLMLTILPVIPVVSAGELSTFSMMSLTANNTDGSLSGSVLLPRISPLVTMGSSGEIVWSAYNARQQAGIAATCAGQVVVTGTNGSFAMQLTRFGHTGAIGTSRTGTFEANGARLDIVRPGYTEWYVSRDDAIEQGMTVTSRPEGSGTLTVSYALSGDLRPVLAGQTLFFFDRYGPVMQYGGLAAKDATGRALPAELTLSSNILSWHIDDLDAVYPISIDPYIATQTAILSASDKASGANFGFSVSLFNDTVVVGAYNASIGGTASAGQAYVFKNSSGTWNQVGILKASDKAANAYFGLAVSIYNDTIVVGAYGATSGGLTNAGQAYVFKNTGGTWSQTALLSASDRGTWDWFGGGVSLYNDTAVIGARNAFVGGVRAGKVYVFRNNGGTWNQNAILYSPDTTEAFFGEPLSVYNDTLVVGSRWTTIGALNYAGQAYVYKNVSGSWNQVAILNASDKMNPAYFGAAISLYNDTIVAGAYNASIGGTASAGQAYVFRNMGGNTWSQVAILNASDKSANANFGIAVSIYNDTIVVGSNQAAPGGISKAGQAYVFKNTGGTWSQVTIMNASDAVANGYFGQSVSLCNDTAVVGAFGSTSSATANAGQAYVFTLDQYLPAPTVASISPVSGVNTTTTSVTITGTGFNTTVAGGTTANLTRAGYNNISITGITPTLSTSISTTIPANIVAGVWNVTVVNPDGRTGTNASVTFTVTNGSSPTPSGTGDSNSADAMDPGRFSSYTGSSPGAAAGGAMTFAINEPATKNAPGAIISVTVVPSRTLGSTSLLVADVDSQPKSPIPDRKTADIASIEPIGVSPSSITRGTITFAVTDSWLTTNGLKPTDIVLMRQSGGVWSELPTTFDHQTGDMYYFTATTPGFSYFAITTRMNATAGNATATVTPSATVSSSPVSTTAAPGSSSPVSAAPVSAAKPVATQTTGVPASGTSPSGSSGIPVLPVIAGIAGIVIVIVAGFFVRRWWIRRQNPSLFRKYD